jgi:glucuronate isomerase
MTGHGMSAPLALHPDRLLGTDPTTRGIAREMYAEIAELPLVCPHGHTDPRWFAENEPFANPTDLLVTPDHYLTRMLYSQGVPMEALGVRPLADVAGEAAVAAPREAWRTFAAHYHLFRGTPSGLWLNHVFAEVFGLTNRLTADTADAVYDHIAACLAQPAFRPRALLDRFRIETIATTDSPLSDLRHHRRLAADGMAGRVLPTFRPDSVTDPEHEHFAKNMERLGALTGRDVERWSDYLAALWERRRFAIAHGATATDHGHPSAQTADLDAGAAQALLDRALAGTLDAAAAEQFRGQLLTEMARMSIEDGLVMQLHPGSRRNHNRLVHERYGRDKGGDIPGPTNYVDALRPLLDRFGNDTRLRIVLFTLDETTYTRELAPLAGHYPTLFLGPPWWFLDSVEGMLRYRRAVTETAGFANSTGFIDDTRAFLSIPARHDVARRVDCRFLGELVADHRLELDEAHEVARDMAVGLSRRLFKLDGSDAPATPV